MRIKDTILDYRYVLKGQFWSLLNRPMPSIWHTNFRPKGNVVLIPGLYERWHFLKDIARLLSIQGYNIYHVKSFSYNREAVDVQAQKLRNYILGKNLKEIVLVTHSKGGLIGWHYLQNFNDDNRVVKLIAIASPFSGSSIDRFVRFRGVKELAPSGKTITELNKSAKGLNKIVSIYPSYDNHIWHKKGSKLEGAKNVRVKVKGHHKILYDKTMQQTILKEVNLAFKK